MNLQQKLNRIVDTRQPRQAKKVAYVLDSFPCLSETFILQEIQELKRQGLFLFLFSLREPSSATFLILKRVQDTPERSVVPASQPVAMARGPLDQPPRFGLTSAPQAFNARS